MGDWTFDGNRVDISPDNVYTKNGMAIIALTKKGQEGFNGQVPQDPEGDAMLNNSLPQSSSSEQFTPPSSSSEQETGILQNRIKVQNREVRGTVNAKGARVRETNKAHYQVDFNY